MELFCADDYTTVYLDMNILTAIKKKEENSDYIYAKIINLSKQGYIFPYSAAHLEEIAKQEDYKFYLKIIDKISSGFSFRVGDFPVEMIDSVIKTFERLCSESNNDKKLNKIYCEQLEMVKNNRKVSSSKNAHFRTRLQKEDIQNYYSRVIETLDHTECAENLQINDLGVRTEKSMLENGLGERPTFEGLRKEHGIKPKRISMLDFEDIFKNDAVRDLIKKEGEARFYKPFEDYSDLKKKYFHYREDVIDSIFRSFEKIGYNQEENNKSQTLRNYTHDISHAIYASEANYFVSNDKRLRAKSKAVYSHIGLDCIVMDVNDFINMNFIKRL